MPAPIIMAGMGAAKAATPIMAKLLPLLKAGYASKYLLPAAIGGTMLGQSVLGELGKAGERGVSREQIRLQELLAETRAGATKTATEESRKRTKEYMKELAKERRKERTQEREMELLRSYTASQDRQMAMIMQAMQAMSQAPVKMPTAPAGGGGMLGLMRSGL